MEICTVLYDAERLDLFEQDIKPLLSDYSCKFIAYSEKNLLNLTESHLILVWLSDEALYSVLPTAVTNHWQIGFLPHPEMTKGCRHFLVAKKIKEAIANIFKAEQAVEADLLYCNDQLVLNAVMLGNSDSMKAAAQLDEGVWSKLKHLIIMIFKVGQVRLQAYQLETKKEKIIRTAALGITVVYRVENSDFTKRLVPKETQDDSNLNGLVLAPRSIFEMIYFLFNRFFTRCASKRNLPSYLGHIKTESLTISADDPIEYRVDGQPFSNTVVQVYLKKNALNVCNINLPKKQVDQEPKEVVRVSGLPKFEAIKELINRPLPWIHHADLEEVKETFVTLSDNAQASQSYLILMVLSTLLATVGLFANSAPVIIGAMILAPLMAPIISLSMGVLRQNTEFIKVSLNTLVTGVALAILFGTLLSLLVPLHTINSEIGARLSPTLLDLGVAIISGIAAAYASARSEVAKSLAGVAIAVALVPPLAVTGIGIGWLDWQVFSGAFLLFMTNLMGIVLAAAATFLIMGFSPFYLAKKGLLVLSLLVVMVSIPLVLSYNAMVTEQSVIYTLEGWKVNGIEVREVKVRNGDTLYVSAKLIAAHPLNTTQIDEVKSKMEILLEKKIQLEAISAVIR
jgi:uncharacterized hydrophobic protein (TIGR00271 family)